MFERPKQLIVLILFLCCFVPILLAIAPNQDEAVDEKIIIRYKQMLERKPKEGSTFDRLYQFYLEGLGLDQMVIDYQTEAAAKPENPNLQLILGHIYKRLGKNTEAIVAYRHAVDLASDDYYPHFALGQMYATLRQHEGAIAALTKAADLAIASQSATPDELTATYKVLGRAYFRRDRIDEAIAAWGKIAELDPENIFSRIELADLFREQELYTQAIEQHEAVVQLKRDDPYRVCLSLREIGKIQEEMREYDAAVQNYDKALALTGQGNWLRKDLHQRIIGIYAHNGDWPGLITYYEGKLAQTPNDVELIGLLANAYIENEGIDEGIAKYQQGLELAPTDARLRLNLITVFRNVERFEDAAAEYEMLSETQPDDFGIYRELGELYLQLKDEDRAKGTYQRMIDRDPNNAGTHLILAEIYTGHEWIDDAVAAYEKAISLAPDNLDYIEYFGEFYFHQSNREKTVETWNRMVAGEGAIAENYDRLAQLLDAKRFRTEAIAASRKAVELAPDEYRHREALARRLMENKDYEKALAEYTEAARLAPNPFFAERMTDQQIEIYRRQGVLAKKIDQLEASPESFEQRKQLAKMYLKLGNVTNALEILIKAKDLKPNDVQVNRWLVELYTKSGRRDEAVTIYNHLVQVDAGNAREYYSDIARLHLRAMDFDVATAAAKQAIAHSPRNPEGHQLLATIEKQRGHYDAAVDSLKQAIRLRSDSTDIRAELADVYRQAGDYRGSIEQYWRCWDLSDELSDKISFVNRLEGVYYDLGRSDELEDTLRQMARVNPNDRGPVLGLAELYRRQGDLPAAREQLVRALEQQTQNPDLLTQLVKINLELGENQEALSYQQRLVKAQPNPHHQQKLGEMLFDIGREQEAVQTWTKLLHARNKDVEAEVKLAGLLSQHGLLDEALSALDRAGEKVTDAKTLYHIGALLVEMNELERAASHFERVLAMSEPPAEAKKNVGQTGHPALGPSQKSFLPDTRRFNLARDIVWQIQRPYLGQTGSTWLPSSFEDAQAGALTQLGLIAQREQRLDDFTAGFEAKAEAHPQDLQILETLAKVNILMEKADKTLQTIDRLIALSPNDLSYKAIRLDSALKGDLDYEAAKSYLDELSHLSLEARLWYTSKLANTLYRGGKQADAKRLIDEIEDTKVTDVQVLSELVKTLTQIGEVGAAEEILAQLPAASSITRSAIRQKWGAYRTMYANLSYAYVRDGQMDKATATFRKLLERTKPTVANARAISITSSHNYRGYQSVQTSFPTPSIYYNQDRLRFLQEFFLYLWTQNQLEPLYTQFQGEFEGAEGQDRIYPGLALSYFYWWEGKRNKAQEILVGLQTEFPDNLTLTLQTAFVSIHTGKHQEAMEAFTKVADKDRRNRKHYNDLILQVAIYTGDTVKVREVLSKVLSSPVGPEALRELAEKLQQSGLTQYAIVAAKGAMKLAMGQRDPNMLMQLSQLLEKLGRGQDAAILAERALRFADRRGRHGQTMYNWYFQQASNLARRRATKEREDLLILSAERNPTSFRAQINLATYYEAVNQIDNAAKAFEAALALRPKDGITRQRYAQMLIRSGRSEAAVTQYTILLENNPNALGFSFFNVMFTFFQVGQAEAIATLAKETIRPSIGRGSGLDFAETVAQQCMTFSHPEGAAEIYEKILEVNPNNTRMYAQLAAAYTAAGNRDKAIQFLRTKLETNGSAILKDRNAQTQVAQKLIELYKASGKLDTIREQYEGRLAENPDDTSQTYLVALIRIKDGNIEDAEPLVNQLLDDMSVTNHEWFNKLAETYRAAGEQEREVRLLDRAIQKLSPWDTYRKSEMYEKLGAALAKQGDKEKAADSFRKMGSTRLMAFGGSMGFWEKQRIADQFMQHEMWDDAEAMYTEVINDLSAQQFLRQQAQERLMEIKRRKSGLGTTTRLGEKAGKMKVGIQRALAKQYMQRDQLSKAATLYKQIITVMPEDLESRAELARIYSRQNKHEAAITEWQTLLEADPENTKYQDGLVNAYQSADRTDEAIELAQGFIEVEESGVHYARLAKVYASIDRIDEAIATYQKAIEINPGDKNVYQELAQLYIRKEDFESAEKMFQYAIQYTGEEWERQNIERQLMELYRRQGKLEGMFQQAESEGILSFEMQRQRAQDYASQGEWEQAANAYKKAMDMTTQSWERNAVSTELVKIYAQLGQIDTAIDLYKTLSRSGLSGMSINWSGPTGFQIYFAGDKARESLINTYRSQGKLDDLLTYFEVQGEATVENPTRLEITAEIHRTRGDYADAAKSYQALGKAQPGNVRSFYYAAAAFNKDGEQELAQTMLDEGEAALSADIQWNQDTWRLTALGSICVEGELYNPAIKLIEDAITHAGRYGGGGHERQQLYSMLAQSYLGIERYEEAMNAYQDMENAAQDDGMRQAAQDGIRRAYRAGNLHEKMVADRTQAVENNPEDPDAHFALAQTYEWSNMHNKAIAAYERADELNPDSAVILAPLAKLYTDANPEKAKTLYKRLIELADEPSDRLQKRWLLIEVYKKLDELDTAIAELRNFVEAGTEEFEREAVLRLLWGIYKDDEQKGERVAVFEELASQIGGNATVYELLGDAYKAVGNQEKASVAYTQWVEFRQTEINRGGRNWDYYHLADQLLRKGIMPEKALEFAKRVTQTHPDPHYDAMLGEAYLLNGQYEESEESFKRALTNPDLPFDTGAIWPHLKRASKNVKDEGLFLQLMEALTGTVLLDATERMHANLVLSTFYHERNQSEEAERYIRKSGVVPESAWWVLGPFDNVGDVGYNKAYIPEDAVEIDKTAAYEGTDGKIGWEQRTDKTLDGTVDLALIFGFGDLNPALEDMEQPNPRLDTVLAYTWTTVNASDERQARIWISAHNPAKIWFNGKEVSTINQDRQPMSDNQHTVPVTLQAGKNSILVKLGGRRWGWKLQLWLTDVDGFPFEDLEFINSPTIQESVEE